MKNFFSNNLSPNKYKKITSGYNKRFSNKFIIQNFGLFVGDKALYKILKILEILHLIKNVNGAIIEFGVWNGNNLLTIKKLIDYLKIKKKIIGYDNFKGMPKAVGNNLFKGDKDLINYICNFFRLKNIKIINDDILNLKLNLKKIPKLALIYIDCDIFETTEKILKLLSGKLEKNGIIVFDEAIVGNGGEGKAAKLFLKNNPRKFKEIILSRKYQPDYILKKIV